MWTPHFERRKGDRDLSLLSLIAFFTEKGLWTFYWELNGCLRVLVIIGFTIEDISGVYQIKELSDSPMSFLNFDVIFYKN